MNRLSARRRSGLAAIEAALGLTLFTAAAWGVASISRLIVLRHDVFMAARMTAQAVAVGARVSDARAAATTLLAGAGIAEAPVISVEAFKDGAASFYDLVRARVRCAESVGGKSVTMEESFTIQREPGLPPLAS